MVFQTSRPESTGKGYRALLSEPVVDEALWQPGKNEHKYEIPRAI